MSLWCNVNTSTGHNDPGQPPECSTSNAGRSAARRTPAFERHQSGSTPPLRLPQIQVPPHFEFQRRPNPSPLSTCPSLHQHHQRRDDMPSTESILRKFFAKHDDISEPLSATRPQRSPAPFVEVPSERISPNEAIFQRRQASQSGNDLTQFNLSQSQQAFQPTLAQSRENRRNPLIFNPDARNTIPSASALMSTSENTHENDRFWENARRPSSSFARNSSGPEASTSFSILEDAGPPEGELYRCSDCNRKCKSKASYLKHRSMMCTHRLGPLTLECRYCIKLSPLLGNVLLGVFSEIR